MADDQDQGYIPLEGPRPKGAAAPVAPAPRAVPDPNDQGYIPLQVPKEQATPPAAGAQPGDWSKVAVNEATMNSLPALRAAAQAARQRLGPAWAASADVAGNFGSPTSALNFVPWVGPELAGAAHEGIKSYMTQPDWLPSGQGWKKIGEDAAAGAVGGVGGHLLGAAASSPEMLKLGAGALGTAIFHRLPAWFPGQEMMGAAGGYTVANKAADWAAEKLASPAAQQALRNLALGGAAALRNSSPSPLFDQWITGQ